MKNLWGYSFVSKCLKINLDFKNSEISWENLFFSWDNSFWNDIVKLPLLKKGYFSSAVNVLPNSTKILYVNKRDYFQPNWLDRDQWMW